MSYYSQYGEIIGPSSKYPDKTEERARELKEYSEASATADAAEKYADLVARTKVEPAYENAHRANLAQAKVEAAIARTRSREITNRVWPSK